MSPGKFLAAAIKTFNKNTGAIDAEHSVQYTFRELSETVTQHGSFLNRLAAKLNEQPPAAFSTTNYVPPPEVDLVQQRYFMESFLT